MSMIKTENIERKGRVEVHFIWYTPTALLGWLESYLLYFYCSLMSYDYSYSVTLLAVPWVGLQYISVVFSGHTYVLYMFINFEESWGKSCFLGHFKRKPNVTKRNTCIMRNTTSLIINSNTIYSYGFLFKFCRDGGFGLRLNETLT